MARTRLHLDYAAIRQLLEGGDMASMIGQATDTVAARLPDGYEHTLKHGPQRVSGRIWTVTNKAKKDQATNHSLESAVGGGI